MFWGGLIVFGFHRFHILHLTFGRYPDVVRGDVYHNVAGFQRAGRRSTSSPWDSLGLHLYHGVCELFQTLGLNHPRYTP